MIWLVAKEALRLLGFGIVSGIFVGMIATRFVASQLFGVSSSDPVTILGAAVTMLFVTGFAILIPVSLALSVDPAIALRYE